MPTSLPKAVNHAETLTNIRVIPGKTHIEGLRLRLGMATFRQRMGSVAVVPPPRNQLPLVDPTLGGTYFHD